VVICQERGADLNIAQLMPLPLTVFCFSEILIGFTFLVEAHLGSPGKKAVKRVYVCVTTALKRTISEFRTNRLRRCFKFSVTQIFPYTEMERHRIGYFGDALPNQSLGSAPKKTKLKKLAYTELKPK